MNIFSFTEKMERGQYPINVPTSRALESLMGILPEQPHTTPPHLQYQAYWLNLRTLYRNVVSSYTADINTLLTYPTIAELMHDEWETIKKVIQNNSRVSPILYLCNYKDLYRRYHQFTIFKKDTTPRQVEERIRMEKSIDQFLHDVGPNYLYQFDTDIKPEHKQGHVIIQTHLVVDLLSKPAFEDLDLLESHTGAIKNPSLWYTKFNNGKDLSMIPFNHYFLRIFGDKEFFSPMDSKLRKDILDLAKKYQWNALTTDGRIRMNIEQLQISYFKEVIKTMM